MDVFCWNVRGINRHSRQRFVRRWVHSNNLLLGSFLETHVAEANVTSVLASTLPDWRVYANYCCSELGRIWVVWDPAVSVLVLKKTDQLMLCNVKLPNVSRSFIVTFVYGRNTELERRDLWDDIYQLASSNLLRDAPWVLMGDFNQIIFANEHYSIIPSILPVRGMEEFHTCLQDNDLVDIPSRAPSSHGPTIRIIIQLSGSWTGLLPMENGCHPSQVLWLFLILQVIRIIRLVYYH